MKFFNGLSVHEPEWDGWIRLSKQSLNYDQVFDSRGFKSFVEALLERAPPAVEPKQRLYLDEFDCVLEEFSNASSRWTKVERLHSLGYGIRDLHKMLLDPVSELLGEGAVLLKDKVNINPHGRTGFPVHQDFESYRHYSPSLHLTVMIPFGKVDATNGCMFFAKGYKDKVDQKDVAQNFSYGYLLNVIESENGRGDVLAIVSNKMSYIDAEVSDGEALLFDSFVPHGSHHNLRSQQRVALFLTFCPERFGFGYIDYYKQRYSVSR
jgi:ectoine hydroxylase-related dioxygenase (phytanoyl-CoA dioxygenase family)